MTMIDEKIAKLKMQQRIEKEKIEEEILKAKEEENVEEEKELELEEVMEAIEEGTLDINNNRYIFRRESYLDNKISIPIPIVFFEELVNKEDNIVLVNNTRGISLNITYIDKGLGKKTLKDFKAGISTEYKKGKTYLSWLDEGEFEKDGVKVLYLTYKTPTAEGFLYNYLFYRYENGKGYIGTYNCLFENIEDWKTIIDATARLINYK